MGLLDGPMGTVARSVVSSLGGSGTYIRAGTGGGYDTETGTIVGAADPNSTPVSVGPGPAADELFGETLVEQGDEVGIVSRTELGFRPNPGADELTWKGSTRRIVGVEAFGSGDEDAAYALLLRR